VLGASLGHEQTAMVSMGLVGHSQVPLSQDERKDGQSASNSIIQDSNILHQNIS
jgi:hypothetical protein